MVYNIVLVVALLALITYGVFMVLRSLAKKKKEEEAQEEFYNDDDSDDYEDDEDD